MVKLFCSYLKFTKFWGDFSKSPFSLKFYPDNSDKNNKKITMEVEGTELDRHKIAPLLTFIFIENAFKYGLKSKNSGFLEIKVVVLDKTFYFSIVNDIDSLGYPSNKSGHGVGGIGIENVKRRLELLYHNKYNLSIIEDLGCFRVRLQLEIE